MYPAGCLAALTLSMGKLQVNYLISPPNVQLVTFGIQLILIQILIFAFTCHTHHHVVVKYWKADKKNLDFYCTLTNKSRLEFVNCQIKFLQYIAGL